MVVQFIVFLALSALICRGTDISTYFSESLGIRDNESRLYIGYHCFYMSPDFDICTLIIDIIVKNNHLQRFSRLVFYQEQGHDIYGNE